MLGCLGAEAAASESIEPPKPVSTLDIAYKVIKESFKNSHYKIIGSCTWQDGKYPPEFDVVPAVEQFLPDLIVTVSNRPETNPWIEARLLYENSVTRAVYQKAYRLATGFDLGFGNQSGQITKQHINEDRMRVVDVIGSPAGFYRLPEITHRPETRFGQAYYLSEADALADRTESAELAYQATRPWLLFSHDIISAGQTWGHEIPRLMHVSNPSRYRASLVAAMHAADIVTNHNFLHVTKSTTNRCGDNCVVSNVVFDSQQKNIIWQEVYPHNRTIQFTTLDGQEQADDQAGNGNYVFVVWRKYRGCVQHPGKLVKFLSFPKVGSPQKR